jgi:glucose-6-phosphate 1-dehydrogenase
MRRWSAMKRSRCCTASGRCAAETLQSHRPRPVLGYLDEEGVPGGKSGGDLRGAETVLRQLAMESVPFYLRSGKGMSCRTTQIVIQFRSAAHPVRRKISEPLGNRLVIQVQPAEGIQLHFETKIPETEMKTRTSHLDFSFQRATGASRCPTPTNGCCSMPCRGRQPVCPQRRSRTGLGHHRSDHRSLESPAAPPLHRYETGLWGPTECSQWMHGQRREWFDVCPVLGPIAVTAHRLLGPTGLRGRRRLRLTPSRRRRPHVSLSNMRQAPPAGR